MKLKKHMLESHNGDLESYFRDLIDEEIIRFRYSKAPVKTLNDMSLEEIEKIEKLYNAKIKKEIRRELVQSKNNQQ